MKPSKTESASMQVYKQHFIHLSLGWMKSHIPSNVWNLIDYFHAQMMELEVALYFGTNMALCIWENSTCVDHLTWLPVLYNLRDFGKKNKDLIRLRMANEKLFNKKKKCGQMSMGVSFIYSINSFPFTSLLCQEINRCAMLLLCIRWTIFWVTGLSLWIWTFIASVPETGF